MAITGTQRAITPARSALLRSGAGRAGWPLTVGRKVLLYALSNIARSDATRSNYTSSRGFVAIGGTPIAGGHPAGGPHIVGDLTITDALNEAPNRAQFRVRGMTPVVGQDLVVTVGSTNNLDRLFAGQVLTFNHVYVGTPANYAYEVSAIDWTWGLGQRLVSRRWQSVSATTIAQDIVAAGAPGYTTDYVAANLPTLDEFTLTDRAVPAALSALATRLGGYWYVDYHKRIHLWTDRDPEPLTDPAILNPIHASLTDLAIETDGTQLVTRALVEGGGSTALADLVPPGETMIPVASAVWYETTGGAVKVGPQRIRYTGRDLGGGGGLVGPGASPSAVLTAIVTGGAGIDAGAHDYAVAFLTAAGESLVGPRTSVVVGQVAAPPTITSAGPVTAGAGPNPGWHAWGITFVTATGETVMGPLMGYVMPAGVDVLAAPTPTAPGFGGSIEAGSFTYAVTFGTASGESTIGPSSGLVTLTTQSLAPVPTAPPTPGSPTTGGSIEIGTFYYLLTNESSAGESTAGPSSSAVATSSTTIGNADAPGMPSNGPNNGQGDLTLMNAYDYAIAYSVAAGQTDHSLETAVVAASPPVNALQSNLGGGKSSTITVTVPFSGSGAVTWTHLYRRNRSTQPADVASFRLLASFANTPAGGSVAYGDLISDATIAGHVAPRTTNSAVVTTNAIPVAVPTGPAGVIRRHLYRATGAGAYRRVVTIGNNTTTSVLDVAASGSIAGNPTPGAGSTQNAIPVAQIPLGPAGVTKRFLYRTNGAGYRLVATIANNSTTSYTDTTPTASLGTAPPTVNTSAPAQIRINDLPIGGPDVTARRIYRTPANVGDAYGLVATVADNTTTTYLDARPDAALGAAPPMITTAVANRVALSTIPIGAGSVTGRKIYRTAAGSSTLKLLTTIADNATTTLLDAAADATLGASPTGTDTSGLSQPAGQVGAGSTTLIVAGTAAFLPGGGWAVIGNGAQVIRYHGVTGTSLTGIPASGPGAITAAIAYNSTVTAAPLILGIPATSGLVLERDRLQLLETIDPRALGDAGAIVYPITKGEDVNLWIVVDDPAAQALVAATFSTAAGGTHSGVIEDVIQDRRLSAAECRARGRAHLAQRTAVVLRVRYRSRDRNTRSGRIVTINLLGAPYSLSAEFMIQSVTIAGFTPNLAPLFQVEASSTRCSFEDLLRRINTRTDPTG